MTVTVTNNITPNYAIALPSLSNRVVDDVPRLISAVSTIDTVLSLKLDASTVGAINGVASLGDDGRLSTTQLPAFIGDVTSTTGSNTLNLSTTGVTAGTYNSVTVDTKGRVTAGSVSPVLPDQSGQTGKYLTTNGVDASWNNVTSGVIPTIIQYSNYTAAANDLVRCNTATGAFNIIFPLNPVDGTIIGVVDVGNTFGINHLTIVPVGGTIENDSSYILDINGTYASFIYNTYNTNWRILETPIEFSVSTVPTWNQNTTGTAAGLSVTLAVDSGGTGVKTIPTGSVLLGNGASAVQTVAPGASGNVLVSNGATWTSGAAPSSIPTQTGNDGKFLTTDGTVPSWQSVAGTPTLATFYWNADELMVNHFDPLLVPSIVDGEFILVYNG
jgi:hypothetical protein